MCKLESWILYAELLDSHVKSAVLIQYIPKDSMLMLGQYHNCSNSHARAVFLPVAATKDDLSPAWVANASLDEPG